MAQPAPAVLAVQAGAEVSVPVSGQPEAAAAAEQALAWRVVGAAVRGVSHERLDLPCQDAQDARLLPDGTLIIALADGAGSARYSEQGARWAVEAGLRALEAALQEAIPAEGMSWDDLLRGAFRAAREAVIQQAAEEAAEEDDDTEAAETESPESEPEGAPSGDEAAIVTKEPEYSVEREYASTLTCVVATADRLAVGQVGDGAVVAEDGNGELFAVTRLQRGEYANETHFITQADALDQLVVDVVERPVSGLAVMSDGLIRLALKMPAQEPHPPFFQPLFRFAGSVADGSDAVRQLEGFLKSERVNARTDDDKSLVLAVRVKTEETPEGEQDRE